MMLAQLIPTAKPYSHMSDLKASLLLFIGEIDEIDKNRIPTCHSSFSHLN